MDLRVVIALLLATGLGGLVVFLVWQGMQSDEATPPVSHRVVLAAQALQPGTVLRAELLKTADWSPAAGEPPQDAFTETNMLAGRVLKEAVAIDAPLRGGALLPEGAGLSGLMTPGMRAVTLHVDQVVGVAGFALPGSRVDVLLTGQADAFKLYGKPPPAGDDPRLQQRLAYSKVILENVRVLALAQQTAAVDGKPQQADSATLEVTPAQAVTLSLARQLGSLALVLRRTEDKQTAVQAGQLELGLLPIASEPIARARRTPDRRGGCVKVYEAGKPVREC